MTLNALGEVMSSTITGFVAEAWADSDVPLPGFGGFVKAKSEEHGIEIIGVVYDVVTGPQDSLHKPTALRMTRQQLKLEQPHIFSLLRTELHVTVCAHRRAKSIITRLPPYPPMVHDFVYAPGKAELEQIGDNLDFLPLLARTSGVPQDELISACLRNIAAIRKDEYEFLVQAGRHLSQVYRDDYDMLTSVLKKIRPVM